MGAMIREYVSGLAEISRSDAEFLQGSAPPTRWRDREFHGFALDASPRVLAPDLRRVFHGGHTGMQLPFTREQFFDLFPAYNAALWPAVIGLWIASALVSALLLSRRRPSARWISVLLAAHWLWSAVAYHAIFFTSINPVAWIFAATFFVQGGVFFWVGVVRGAISFAPRNDIWAPLARGLIAYSLVYPAINAVEHDSVSRIPAFGVPCPTTIFTAGVLMLATPRSWRIAVIPVVWSVIGGSAAFLLGVRADYALPVAGIALALCYVRGSTVARSEHRHRERQVRVGEGQELGTRGAVSAPRRRSGRARAYGPLPPRW